MKLKFIDGCQTAFILLISAVVKMSKIENVVLVKTVILNEAMRDSHLTLVSSFVPLHLKRLCPSGTMKLSRSVFSEKEVEQISAAANITEKEKCCYNSLLQSNSSTLEELLKDWRLTYNIRMVTMKSLESHLNYFHTFPSLKQPTGYKLVSTLSYALNT